MAKIALNRVTVVGLLLATLAALYFAAAGWERVRLQAAISKASTAPADPILWDGVPFKNPATRDNYIAWSRAERFFPITFWLPAVTSLFVTVMVFGYLGGALNFLFEIIHQRAGVPHPLLGLLFSSFSGLLMLLISLMMPETINPKDRPLVLLFFCLLGGVFSKQLLLRAKKKFDKLLT